MNGGTAQARPAERKRVAGRYIVFAIAAIVVGFLAFTYTLAVRLTPAADRFHEGQAVTPR